MADVSIFGTIQGVRHTEQNITLTVTEYRAGYKKHDGTQVDEQVLAWKVVFKAYFRKYISTHFANGMLVWIKGTMLPYQYDKEHKCVDGYTIYGQTIDRASYPKNIKREQKMIVDSQRTIDGTPDIEAYKENDF